MPAPHYFLPAPKTPSDAPAFVADLCVYGATAAGVMAAVQARRLGLSVALLNPAWQVGGMTSGGLGMTDFGSQAAIGGLAREFYKRVGQHYGKEVEWCFEPHVAECVLQSFLKESGVAVQHGQYVETARVARDRAGAARITELTTTSRLCVQASYFIDCSYEGDLMAAAGVSFNLGREAAVEHGECFNGQQIHATHQFDCAIDPYVRPGEPQSGLLIGIDPDPSFLPGAADRRIQAYNFRVCLTRRSDIRVPFPKPESYEPERYELLARWLRAGGGRNFFGKFDAIQGDKTDTNNNGAFSTDFIGGSWDWPEASYAERERIFQDHVTYQQGLQWFMANEEAVPVELRTAYAHWGLAGDEFNETGHWPHQLYVREARRLNGEALMTQGHCLSWRSVEDPIALGAYNMDSHNCRRIVINGYVLNEGDVQIKLPQPYGISYRAIMPRRSECTNLLVPVCLSATHIAYGSIRMEPVFMVLAQSAAVAAALCLREGRGALQSLAYVTLRAHLVRENQVLNSPVYENG